MNIAQSEETTLRQPLRLWPGVVIVVLQWLARFGIPMVEPDAVGFGVLAGLAGGLALVVWWAFFSRAPRLERWGALVLMVAVMAATVPLLHESVRSGMMGMMFVLYAVPTLSLAFVAWAVAGRRLADGPRRAAMVVAILLGCGGWALVRTGGFTGDLDHDFAWRWAPTPEERLLARAGEDPVPPPPAPVAEEAPEEAPVAQAEDGPAPPPEAAEPPAEPLVARTGGETQAPTAAAAVETAQPEAAWPGFRGAARDGRVHGARFATDWSLTPPVELWRRPIGPGWSSFAVRGDRLYTQEQRGEDEVVSCHDLATGEPVWRHRDATRFWESNGGPGPRATPALHGGRVYTLGATGILNALDAATGAVVWSRDAAADTGAEVPTWGFAGSPLVVGDAVLVATAGRLAAYDLATGEPRWLGPDGGAGYSSPHLLTLDGVEQILLLSATGLTGFAPADGTVLWEHPWPGYPIVQPARTADGDLLISVRNDSGTRRLAVARGAGGWTIEERWTSRGLKPYFNDFVVHRGHAFGFDGSYLASIDLEDGERRWKGGRYGGGQLVLLAEQDVLLVLSERGEVALVAATPDGFTELARFAAIEGKTWNHPVLAGDVLLVRNGREMAAFRLPRADG